MQLVKFELPAGDQEPVEQLRHEDISEAPTAVEYFPASHWMHEAVPGGALYHPASHGAHVPPAGPQEPALQMQLVKFEL